MTASPTVTWKGAAWRSGLALIIVAILYGLRSTIGAYELQLLVLASVYVILVSGLNLLVGHAGLVSIGQQAFFGIGAYVSALMTVKAGVPSYVGVLAAMVAVVPIAALVGKITLRLRAAFFVIATLAVAEIFRYIVINSVSFTGGPNGLTNVPPLELPGMKPFLSPMEAMLPLSLIAAIVVIICWAVASSRFGSQLRAMRENEELAKAMGINTPAVATKAFLISALFAALAGALYAHFVGFISPEVFAFSLMVTMLLMLVGGGMGTVMGPVIGAVAFTLLPEYLRFSDQWRLVIYGLALVALARFLPEGLWGGLTRAFHAVRSRVSRQDGPSQDDDDAAVPRLGVGGLRETLAGTEGQRS